VGVIDRSDESFRGCCPALNFFESPESGECWLNDQHGGARDQVVSMHDAIAAGRAVFGVLLPLVAATGVMAFARPRTHYALPSMEAHF
jgi:hypothetical protein